MSQSFIRKNAKTKLLNIILKKRKNLYTNKQKPQTTQTGAPMIDQLPSRPTKQDKTHPLHHPDSASASKLRPQSQAARPGPRPPRTPAECASVGGALKGNHQKPGSGKKCSQHDCLGIGGQIKPQEMEKLGTRSQKACVQVLDEDLAVIPNTRRFSSPCNSLKTTHRFHFYFWLHLPCN